MTESFILGGYTRRTNNGLKKILFNNESKMFEKATDFAQLNNPTYVTFSTDGQFLFSIHKDTPNSGIVAFKKINENEWLEVSRCLNTVGSGCHISYRESSRTIYVSNYGEGALNVYHFSPEEKLTHLQRIEHHGSSVHENQESPHVHYAGVSRDESHLYVCDLGTDKVSTYLIDSQGKLTLEHELHLPAGTGPRHLVKHPTENYVYIIGELDNTTTAAKLNDDASLSIFQCVPNIPEEFKQTASGAAIRITRDGRYLYTSTRYHDVITVFSINQINGHLEHIQTVSSVGKVPRDFILDKTEKYLLAAHQDSDYISLFERDKESGKLNFLHNEVYAPECVCLVSMDAKALN